MGHATSSLRISAGVRVSAVSLRTQVSALLRLFLRCFFVLFALSSSSVFFFFLFFSFVHFLRTKKTAWELTDSYPKRKTPSAKGSSSTHNCCLKKTVAVALGGRKIVSDLGPTSLAITSFPKRAFSAGNYAYVHIEDS